MSVNSLPKTVTRQRRGCDLNPGPSAHESNHSATEPPSFPVSMLICCIYKTKQSWMSGFAPSAQIAAIVDRETYRYVAVVLVRYQHTLMESCCQLKSYRVWFFDLPSS